MRCKKCGCSISRFSITGLCKNCRQLFRNLKQRDKLKEEHRCYDCGNEVIPELVYKTRCKKCRKDKNLNSKKIIK